MATAEYTREFNIFEETDRAAFLNKPIEPDMRGVDLGAGLTANGYPRAKVLTDSED